MNYSQYYGQGMNGPHKRKKNQLSPYTFQYGPSGLPFNAGFQGGSMGPSGPGGDNPYGWKPPGRIPRPTGQRPPMQMPYGFSPWLKSSETMGNRPPYQMYPMPPGTFAGAPPYQTPPYIPEQLPMDPKYVIY